MTTYLRDQLAAARINRTKARTAAWWHRTHCLTCSGSETADHRERLMRILFSAAADAPTPASDRDKYFKH